MLYSSYVQCANGWLIDENYRFIPMAQKQSPFEIDVPFFFWNYGIEEEHTEVTGFHNINGVLQNVSSTFRKTSYIVLNHLEVEFRDEFKDARMRFYDSLVGEEAYIQLNALQDRVVAQNPGGKKLIQCLGIQYAIDNNGQATTFGTKFVSQHQDVRDFCYINGLAKYENWDQVKKFCYGVLPRPYKVVYKGHELGGTSLALLCGPWGILLGDDLTFDSLVCLKGVRQGVLTVDRFAYTVNPYVCKATIIYK